MILWCSLFCFPLLLCYCASPPRPISFFLSFFLSLYLSLPLPHRPPVPEWVPAPYAELLHACWQHDPADRPTAAHVVELLTVCTNLCTHALLHSFFCLFVESVLRPPTTNWSFERSVVCVLRCYLKKKVSFLLWFWLLLCWLRKLMLMTKIVLNAVMTSPSLPPSDDCSDHHAQAMLAVAPMDGSWPVANKQA
jgi:hypothetical protein